MMLIRSSCIKILQDPLYRSIKDPAAEVAIMSRSFVTVP